MLPRKLQEGHSGNPGITAPQPRAPVQSQRLPCAWAPQTWAVPRLWRVSQTLAGAVHHGRGPRRVPQCPLPSPCPDLHSHSKWKSHGSLSCETLTGGRPFTQWMLATGLCPSRTTWLWPSHRATVQSGRVQDSFTWERRAQGSLAGTTEPAPQPCHGPRALPARGAALHPGLPRCRPGLDPECHSPARATRRELGGPQGPGQLGHWQEAHLSGRDDEVTALRLGGRGRGGGGGLRGRGSRAGTLEAVNVTVVVADGVEGAARAVRLVVHDVPCEETVTKTTQQAQLRRAQEAQGGLTSLSNGVPGAG